MWHETESQVLYICLDIFYMSIDIRVSKFNIKIKQSQSVNLILLKSIDSVFELKIIFSSKIHYDLPWFFL